MQTRSFVGPDVHKAAISVSVAEDGRTAKCGSWERFRTRRMRLRSWLNGSPGIERWTFVTRQVAADTGSIASSRCSAIHTRHN
jgi:hypothetical protein